MKEKRKILVLTQHLKSIGGSELETITTTKVFLDNNIFNSVTIFSLEKKSSIFNDYLNGYNVIFKNYPSILSNKFITKIDSLLKKIFITIPRNFSLFEFLYWFFKSKFEQYDIIYVVTSTYQVFYFPIIFNFNLKNVVIRHTGISSYNNWNKFYEKILKNCKVILVTAKSQKDELIRRYKLENVDNLDVFIENEINLLNNNHKNFEENELFTIGMLCRISKEKRIEDAIMLIKKLVDLNYLNVKLIIQGVSLDKSYFDHLVQLVVNNSIQSRVIINPVPVYPNNIVEFYKKIDLFLITSVTEGGPTTGLESIAIGVPVLSYNIGAMSERLKPFKDLLIANNFNELVFKSQLLLNMNKKDYVDFSERLKNLYKENYTNVIKLKKLEAYLK